MTSSESVQKRIDEIIQSDKIVLFMKGNRSFPQCGFSATVVQILNQLTDSYTTINVLSDPDIRQGIKEYSSWPTIPQLYVQGEFIGGCDIVQELHQTGELSTKLGTPQENVPPPQLHITPSAQQALSDALSQEQASCILLSISPEFVHALDLSDAPKGANIVQVDGLSIAMDPGSAKRANGLTIDYVTGPEQQGFKMDNPNAPANVIELSPEQLQAKLDAGEIQELFDVRTVEEREIATLKDARLLDDETMAYAETLDKSTPIAFYCHHGRRSRAAAEHFRNKGFRKLYNLAGGIDAWSLDIDPDVPRY